MEREHTEKGIIDGWKSLGKKVGGMGVGIEVGGTRIFLFKPRWMSSGLWKHYGSQVQPRMQCEQVVCNR